MGPETLALPVNVVISVVLAYGMSLFPHYVEQQWFSICVKGEAEEQGAMKARLSKPFIKNCQWCAALTRSGDAIFSLALAFKIGRQFDWTLILLLGVFVTGIAMGSAITNAELSGHSLARSREGQLDCGSWSSGAACEEVLCCRRR